MIEHEEVKIKMNNILDEIFNYEDTNVIDNNVDIKNEVKKLKAQKYNNSSMIKVNKLQLQNLKKANKDLSRAYNDSSPRDENLLNELKSNVKKIEDLEKNIDEFKSANSQLDLQLSDYAIRITNGEYANNKEIIEMSKERKRLYNNLVQYIYLVMNGV